MATDGNQPVDRTHRRPNIAARLLRPHARLFRRSQRLEPSAARIANAPTPGQRPEPDSVPFDVICAGMYRACSTWQYEVAAQLVEHAYLGQRLGYLTGAEYGRLMRADRRSQPSTPAGPKQWRVFKSHEGDG